MRPIKQINWPTNLFTRREAAKANDTSEIGMFLRIKQAIENGIIQKDGQRRGKGRPEQLYSIIIKQ